MTMDTKLTMRSSLPHLFSSQVGGHAGIQTTQGGSLLLKPALLAELECYQLICDGVSPDINATTETALGLKLLLPWIPRLLGVVS
ncbi:hypothetical protein EDD16DRAFT_1664657, partial [Pisolithus croceorrhizus]